MKLFSQIIGIVFHPVLLSLLGVYLIVHSSTQNFQVAVYWTIISTFFAFLIGIFVYIGVRKGFFNNLDVSNRKQRVILYPFAIFVIILFGIFVFIVKGPFVLIESCIVFTISLLLLDLINSKIKASVHVASVAALVTGIITIYGYKYIPFYLLVLLSAYARIVGKRHTVNEAIVGAFCGILLTVIGIFVVQLF